jgi:hypothetical protein
MDGFFVIASGPSCPHGGRIAAEQEPRKVPDLVSEEMAE